MILRDRCGTSYDLASIFRGRRSTLHRWSGKIAKRISFHGFCPKGKQKANRGGFSFCIWVTFVNGWAWGSALFRDYSNLDKAKQATSGLCFDAEGTAFTLKYVNDLNREVFEHLVRNTEDLSSYSWRRAGPTVGTLMKLSPLPTTKWRSPWQVGVNCTPQDWIPYYVQYIRETLWMDLNELEGMVLVCDCPAAQTCEADLLAGLVFDRLSPSGHCAAPQVVHGQHARATKE